MIKLQSVYKEYEVGTELQPVLKDINLEFKKGELVSIIGPSGSGKSTLMHLIGLLDKPSRGTVLVNGKDTARLSDNNLSKLRNHFVGFVFQQFNLIPKLTVLENILLPTLYSKDKLDFDPTERALDLLKRVDLIDKKDFLPNKISGGQQQRVAIARALMMNPALILADEPTGNLDTKTGNSIIDLLSQLNKKEKITIIIVTHEATIAKRTKRQIRIVDGALI